MRHPLLRCNDKRPNGIYIATVTEEGLCLDQLKVTVKWLKDHNVYRNTIYSGISITGEDWQTLEAAIAKAEAQP